MIEKISKSINALLPIKVNADRATLILKASFITIMVIALYAQDLALVFRSALSNEAEFHILAIPPLFVYLLYRKRKMTRASMQEQQEPPKPFFIKHFATIIGALLCAIAMLLYWYGSYTFTPLEFHIITLPIMSTGLTLIFFNWQTVRQLAFPIAFLFLLTPPPSEILFHVGSTLASISAEAANAIANIIGVNSTLSAEYGSPVITLTRPDQTIMQFNVDIACSGVYSLIGFTIFAIFIAYITRSTLKHKLAILLLGLPLIVALNIIRITIILAIGYHYGAELALQIFHAVGASILMFIGTLILLAITEKAFKKPKQPEPCAACNQPNQNKTQKFCPTCGKLQIYPILKLKKSDIAKIVSITLLIAVLLSIQAPVFALTEGPAEVLIQTPAGIQINPQRLPLPQIPGYNLSYIYRDTAFEERSGQDASLVYAYKPQNSAEPTIWVSIELAATKGKLHRWETCLINYPLSRGWQPRVIQLDSSDVQIQENPPIIARYFAFQYVKTNQTQAVLYWYETATFKANSTAQQKHAKISLVTYPESSENITAYKNMMLPIAIAINNYWQPIKTWTAIALAISQNGIALSAVATGILAALLIFRLYLYHQEKTSLMNLYNKLPEEIRQLITAIKNSQKYGAPTARNIAVELQNQTKTTYTEAQITEMLLSIQKTGLIKQTIVNKNDNPITTWKSLI